MICFYLTITFNYFFSEGAITNGNWADGKCLESLQTYPLRYTKREQENDRNEGPCRDLP